MIAVYSGMNNKLCKTAFNAILQIMYPMRETGRKIVSGGGRSEREREPVCFDVFWLSRDLLLHSDGLKSSRKCFAIHF